MFRKSHCGLPNYVSKNTLKLSVAVVIARYITISQGESVGKSEENICTVVEHIIVDARCHHEELRYNCKQHSEVTVSRLHIQTTESSMYFNVTWSPA